MDERGPLCVGVDPHAALLADWGLDDDVAGLERFSRTVVEALADRVAVLKPQSAFFERFGSRGVAVLERTVAEARAAGALVVMDAKRGDIGSTMAAYADAYLDPASPLFSDALTVSPYLGFGSLRPAVDRARTHGCGLFVLALTSNPEGAEVQHAVGEDGRAVAASVLAHLAAENGVGNRDAAGNGNGSGDADGSRDANGGAGADGSAGVHPYATGQLLGSFGAVVGATLGAALGPASGGQAEQAVQGGHGVNLDIGGPLLAPGIGAQGATAADLPHVFGTALRNVLPSISRGVLRYGPSAGALREAAAAEARQLADVLTPGA
ncbi:Orotidine 5'-phosphate decarboxylase [Streptomyces nanshensis]|uniref:Orotidine-5'-phosphate decarboxylase n=2 Tax=Streptomyces nanshensis TaxID=518642 RepID=A0A1E7LAI8_9ACTN|nr:Orotidine 5'-phosphate decarboxylase [Streptomyces nanshensis]